MNQKYNALYQTLSDLHSRSKDCQLIVYPFVLKFIKPAGTSRGSMMERKIWIVKVNNENQFGFGECAPLLGLSPELNYFFEDNLVKIVREFNLHGIDAINSSLEKLPSFRFALETALLDMLSDEQMQPFKLDNKLKIPINGLIWMGPVEDMQDQASALLEKGFKCFKLKIGNLNWDSELRLLQWLRDKCGNEVELRVDANGAFGENAKQKLQELKELNIHSIEQPIEVGNLDKMAAIARSNTIPIALDEELLRIRNNSQKRELLEKIMPQYIVLKPGLLGGFKATLEWIEIAEQNNIGWWITSALESNIGLNAIARFTALLENPIPQGLGTGSLYTNNITSPLEIKGAHLVNGNRSWSLPSGWNA